MTQPSEHDKKPQKDRDDHFHEGNPMPDTHHVNPKSDDPKKSHKDDKNKR
ncbi:hypothetical protein [Halovibrio sp. HP20-50]|nr:hypothetical protein [Halovibrio sp. HP20-59]MEA2118969.1 hypothetical protein [Halovibrio sp. HP20-59]